MEEVKPENDADIAGLVNWLDSKQKDRKNPLMRNPITEIYRGELRDIAFAFLIAFFIVWFCAYEYALNLASEKTVIFDSLLVVSTAVLSGIAMVLAGMTFIQPYFIQNETNVRYRRALDFRKKESEKNNEKEKIRDFTEEEKILMKALIMIMGINEDISLRKLYDADKNHVIFSRDSLLKRLCSREEVH